MLTHRRDVEDAETARRKTLRNLSMLSVAAVSGSLTRDLLTLR